MTYIRIAVTPLISGNMGDSIVDSMDGHSIGFVIDISEKIFNLLGMDEVKKLISHMGAKNAKITSKSVEHAIMMTSIFNKWPRHFEQIQIAKRAENEQ